MTEYWKSQAKKFCNDCKCWIADNKAGIAFHENGRKHQENVRKRLYDIKHRSTLADIKKKEEAEILEQMEKRALNAYRTKDLLSHHGDITGKIFHERRAQREAEKERQLEEERRQVTQAAAAEAAGPSDNAIGPRLPAVRVNALGMAQVETPKSGTKWHRSQPKVWYEARSDEGHSYFWHVETNESRWDPPPEGYLSIAEQEEINKKHEDKEAKKIYNMYQSQSIHGSHLDEVAPTTGPDNKSTPYGEWVSVESTQPRQTYFQADSAPKPKDPERKFNFSTKATPSVSDQWDGEASKPSSSTSFKFKKRKGDDAGSSFGAKKQFRKRTDF